MKARRRVGEKMTGDMDPNEVSHKGYLASSALVENATRLLFYHGAALMLLFITWVQIAPYGSTNPEWWNPEMAKVAMAGAIMLVMAVAFLGAAVLYDGLSVVYRMVVGNDGS